MSLKTHMHKHRWHILFVTLLVLILLFVTNAVSADEHRAEYAAIHISAHSFALNVE